MTRVAVAQLDAGRARDVARRQAVDAVERAAETGADLVVLPEYASGWTPDLGPDLVEDLDGPFVTELRRVARSRAVAVVAGVVAPAAAALEELDADPRGANLALAVDPGGEVVGTYTKVHLFDAFDTRESEALVPGPPEAPPLVLDAGGLRFGVLTCYDLRFPESARRVVDAGADVLVVIAAWASGPGKVDQLRVLARARALENTSYLVLASQCGAGRTGHSGVVDPWGVPVVEAGASGDQILVADLDEGAVADARRRVPVLRHRRYAVVPRP